MVSTTLFEKYPTYLFLGEETYKPGTHLTAAPTFICDPIDGTTNFVHGYPYVSISLGFTNDLEPLVGVVYNPFTSTLYSAIKGHGAFKNKTQKLPLRSPPPPLKDLSGALVAVEWGSDRSGSNYDVKIKTFRKLAADKKEGGAMVHSLKSLGSAALNLCSVAEGTLDIYWEGGCWAWDVCAGMCILKEAGGNVVDANPGNWTALVEQRRYLAVRGLPVEGEDSDWRALVTEFWDCVGGKLDYEV